MSIFNKVLILFVISLVVMVFVSNETSKLTESKIETVLKDKYIEFSNELFTYLSNSEYESLQKKLKELKFEIIEDKENYLNFSQIIYENEISFGVMKILKYDDRYLLYMSYLGDDILAINTIQDEDINGNSLLNYMIIADMLILIILFLMILKILSPLRKISKRIKQFGEGNYKSRIINFENDEIGELSQTFNSMATNIEKLIKSRQILLRDIGHELRTPISKSKLALEMIEDSKYKDILKKALFEIDEMTSELLHLEKLNSNQDKLKFKYFNVETLIIESLSKLFIEDESLINIEIEVNFTIYADLNYLSIALKNLIDNGLKYTTKTPISLIVKEKQIIVKSQGLKLSRDLEYYCEAFTQADNSRNQRGYGLGLSMIKRILERHDFKLLYFYEQGFNLFIIDVRSYIDY